jgi:hypothetical protein
LTGAGCTDGDFTMGGFCMVDFLKATGFWAEAFGASAFGATALTDLDGATIFDLSNGFTFGRGGADFLRAAGLGGAAFLAGVFTDFFAALLGFLTAITTSTTVKRARIIPAPGGLYRPDTRKFVVDRRQGARFTPRANESVSAPAIRACGVRPQPRYKCRRAH